MKVHRIIAIAAAAALTIPTYSSAAENEPKHKIVGYLPDWNLSVNALEYESFVYDFINEKIIITNYTGVTEGTITIPNKIEGKEVLEIGEKAFYGLLNKNSTVVISDNISIINDYAFTGLIGIGMNAIYIPESIEYIGKYSIGYTYYPNSNMQNGCVDDQYKAYPVKIYGYPGTVAETYAKDNGFAFIPLSVTSCHNKTSYGFYYTIGGSFLLYAQYGAVHFSVRILFQRVIVFIVLFLK